MNFNDRPIHQKLIAIIFSTLAIAILLVSMAVIGYDRYQSKKIFAEQIHVLADITAKRSGAALVFNDRKTLKSNLTSLLGRSAIDRACIYNGRGHLVIQQQVPGLEPSCQESINWNETPPSQYFRQIDLVPITARERNVGFLWVEANTRELESRLWRNVLVLFTIGLLAGAASWQLTKSLRRTMLWPLLELNAIADSITISGNYSMRAKLHGGDEVGSLAKTFNRLLSSIQRYEINTNELILEFKESKLKAESQFDLVDRHNQQIREMFAGASHDLRQPLQAIVLFTTALQASASDKQAPVLDKLQMAVDNLSNLFEELLDVSQLEAKLDSVELEEMSIKPILENVFHEFDALAEDKALELRFHVRDTHVLANATLLERIIRNLLSNAIRYTDSGAILLSCRDRHDAVWLEIWDSGPGIAPDKLQSIFDQFVQLDNAPNTTGKREGFGLGLAIVKRLTDLLGFRVEVDSKLGSGSRFRIILPKIYRDHRRIEDFDPAYSQEPPKELEGKNLQAKKPERLPPLESLDLAPKPLSIVLIDDDPAILESLGELLRTWGMDVLSFASIGAIKEHFSHNSLENLDLIISDFQISEIDTGFDAIELLHDYFGDDIPALIMTGTGDPSLLAEIQASNYPLMRKPVSPGTLRSSIHHLLGRL